MAITFDPAKRSATLAERNLDFASAGSVFAGQTVDRRDHGEVRVVTIGLLHGRMVVLA